MNGIWKFCGITFLGYQTFRNLHFYYHYRKNKVKVIDLLYDVYDLLPKMYPMNLFSKDEWKYWERNLSIQNGMADFYDAKIQKNMRSMMIYRKKLKMYIDKIDIYDPKGFQIIEEYDLKCILDLMFQMSVFHWERFYQLKKDDFDKEIHIQYYMKKLDTNCFCFIQS